MFLRNERLLFIHIPKTAGESFERSIAGDRIEFGQEPDYEHLWGWCPDRRLWLQHATPRELVETQLVSDHDLTRALKVAVVRNPFDRAVSDYYQLHRRLGPRASFIDMLTASGSWQTRLGDRRTPSYQGDHIRPQVQYLGHDVGQPMDHVGRFESLETTWQRLEDHLGRPLPRSRHNLGASPFEHYSHFYSDREVSAVARRYAEDLAALDYQFDDRRTIGSRMTRARLRGSLLARKARRSAVSRARVIADRVGGGTAP
ncbi:MAG: sulfotransferase family 2 domain-containing protein [Actinomycetota bacterium]